MTKKLVVIGSNSFSGAHLVDAALKEGMTVLGISRSIEPDSVFLPYKWGQGNLDRFSFFQLDLNHDLDQIMTIILGFQPAYIVNFAAQGMVAQSWNSPEDWLQTNTLSAVKLHFRLLGCGSLKKFIQISTPEVYGSRTGIVKENTCYDPSTPYAVSKAAADMNLMAMHRQYGFPVVFTRASNVYGPGQQLYRVIPKAAIHFLTARPFELHGGGTSVRSFIHIKDVVQGTLKTMVHGTPGTIYHFSTDEYITIRSLVKCIADQIGISFTDNIIDVQERAGKDKYYKLDAGKAGRELGWKAGFELEAGIKETISWIKRNISDFKNRELGYIHKP
ncbi:NAD-dependent epimerase/dehydratase family protein [Desulfobacter latus]|uniref:GDP-mannose 4,6-dehydratase n=1 Tax=Desulfobacter latus TaxID=2292 RepID=A0A850T6G9_9BACT|nr:GDP-mannose 4,6-dehydratase [Desulfobacter latus]NWH04952.1 GDP-mannose 4,6-dehydratase [Desulfobacter latus]